MNWLKLKYLRWKNKSDWVFKRKFNKITPNDIYFNIKPTTTYKDMIHNFIMLYKVIKLNPDSKLLKEMVNSAYLNICVSKQRWKFAKIIYRIMKERINKNEF